LAALVLAATGCAGHSHSIEGFGLKLELPPGWTGEIYGRGYSRANDLVILHAASFRLGPHDGYDPMGRIERNDRLVDARRGMRSDDVGIGVFAYSHVPGPPAPELHGELTIRPSDRKGIEGYPAGRATFERTFTLGGRQVQVVVEFGSEHPQPRLFDRVNDVLRSLSIGSK
jgi:hypothetical protein